jgi:hypothetical protein
LSINCREKVNLRKEYLKLPVNEIRGDKMEMRLTDSYAALQAHFLVQQYRGFSGAVRISTA